MVGSKGRRTYVSCMDKAEWTARADAHFEIMVNLLYPPVAAVSSNKKPTGSSSAASLLARRQSVKTHPIYNFFHTYYKFSSSSLLRYSPGANVLLKGSIHVKSSDALHEKLRVTVPDEQGFYYSSSRILVTDGSQNLSQGKRAVAELTRTREILEKCSVRRPNFGCFGMHEWAMLYQPEDDKRLLPKQPALPLRVSQRTINDTVDTVKLRCTHFDAFRFFHPATQPKNVLPNLQRSNQAEYEQPGCIHNTMDLFRTAYLLYPLISAGVLQEAVELALKARVIDMRSSPYDISAYLADVKDYISTISDDKDAIRVETPEGRKLMMLEQEALFQDSQPVRIKLLAALDDILQQVS
jgi:hypothetical protein